jgi:XTP/dITP diphosphohydrolase
MPRAVRDSRDVASDLPGAIAALARRIAYGAKAGGGQPVPDLGGQPVPDLDREVGNLLFAAVALADAAGVDPEAALRRTARTFRDRIVALERLAPGNA